MKKLQIQGATGQSTLMVGESLQNLNAHLPGRQPIIITDESVHRLYAAQFPPGHVITIGGGENIKTLDTVSRIYAEMVTIEADRSSWIVGIGGGIVCDIAGFVASTYMRGVPFGFVPSTLLAQVDASVGGKNGVNFGGYKNMVGTFNQPDFVLCDLDLLQSLPAEQLQCGFAEIVNNNRCGILEPASGFCPCFWRKSSVYFVFLLIFTICFPIVGLLRMIFLGDCCGG